MHRPVYVVAAVAIGLFASHGGSSAIAHEALVSKHAAAHGVPEALVKRVIQRESRGNPRAVSKGNYGLMQIRLGTARAMGYRGDAAGLLDADTNMTYAVKYLAGAYRTAGGNSDRAIAYYQRGYYYQAKAMGTVPGATASSTRVRSSGADTAAAIEQREIAATVATAEAPAGVGNPLKLLADVARGPDAKPAPRRAKRSAQRVVPPAAAQAAQATGAESGN